MVALRIGHMSDTHLGARPYGLVEREVDFYRAFDEAIDVFIQERVDLVIHSGDLFDAPHPGGDALYGVARALKRLRDKGIRFYFTLGEHDISRLGGRPAPYVYHEVGLAVYLKDGEPVRQGDLTIIGFHKRRRAEAELLRQALASVKVDGRGVLVMHQGLKEFHPFAWEIGAADLPRGFDYYAMGHLHDRGERRFEWLKGPVCYPGSTEATAVEGIKEHHKGVYVVDLSGDEAKPQWIELRSVRKQASYEVDYKDLRALVERLVAEMGQDRPMLYFKVRAEEGVDNSKISAVLKLLEGHDLYHDFEVVRPKAEGKVLLRRPADVGEEMLELAAAVLGSREAAEFAVKDLLPLLKGGRTEEALEVLWSSYKSRRFG